jgi:hypothetical protein
MYQPNFDPIRHQISLQKPGLPELQDAQWVFYLLENQDEELKVYRFPEYGDRKRLITQAEAAKYLHYLNVSTHFPEEYQQFKEGTSQSLYIRIDRQDEAVLRAATR